MCSLKDPVSAVTFTIALKVLMAAADSESYLGVTSEVDHPFHLILPIPSPLESYQPPP